MDDMSPSTSPTAALPPVDEAEAERVQKRPRETKAEDAVRPVEWFDPGLVPNRLRDALAKAEGFKRSLQTSPKAQQHTPRALSAGALPDRFFFNLKCDRY